MFAPCPQGLETALVDELHALGYDDAHPGRAGAHFTADWAGMMRANLESRLATRVLVRVAHGTVRNEDELLELARATPWERWFGAEQTLRVDTSAVRSPMKSLQFCNLRVKDGICDRLRELEGERPSIDTVRPDARVHAFLDETSATLYLDTSGESLFKRGWRLDKGEAPLRENLAAGLLALSGWPADVPLIDPFCGSGTILIEAALKGLRVPPGISRPFAFERLRDHQDRRWRDLKDDARARILPELPMQLAGADIDPRAIDAARGNAQRAGLTEDAVYFEIADARDTCPLDERPGWLITNPPTGSAWTWRKTSSSGPNGPARSNGSSAAGNCMSSPATWSSPASCAWIHSGARPSITARWPADCSVSSWSRAVSAADLPDLPDGAARRRFFIPLSDS